MSKQISVHNHKCTKPCEHANICYYINGKHKDSKITSDKIDEVINKISGDDNKIYYSVCDFMSAYITYSDSIYPNTNRSMTISNNIYKHFISMFNPSDRKQFNKKVQLTVYTADDLGDDNLKDIQKMFLIKDQESYELAELILRNPTEYHNIHFPIYHEWAKANQDLVLILVGLWLTNSYLNTSISLDSCLENYIVNNKCVYAENYIDLRYDGSVRRCPFSDESHDIDIDNPDNMFNIPFTPNCIWHELFYKEGE